MASDTVHSASRASTSRAAVEAGPAWLLVSAFAAVYVVWGSTYFAIRVAVESIPPFLMAGLRHFSVGLAFYPIFRRVSGEKPTVPQWRTTAITGCLLLFLGNGTVSWAERVVPSGIAALLVATVSLWMVLIDWLRPGGTRPAPRVMAGFLLGFAGMVLWWGPSTWGAPSGSIRREHWLCSLRLSRGPAGRFIRGTTRCLLRRFSELRCKRCAEARFFVLRHS